MENDKNKRQSGLVEIRDILKGELNKFSVISNSMDKTSKDFLDINKIYTSLKKF